ncbi:hypothetical protein [Spirochaeta africana]|nr:hypothetical protein [Spirochaeta africana]
MERIESRRVFFLYPHSVFQEHLLDVLVQAEFEVAVVRDHSRIPALLARFPGSILFINIEQQLANGETWEEFVRSLRERSELQSIRIGILAYNPDPERSKHFIADLGVECGFITLKLGIKQSAAILLKSLAVNEARGRRKYVRATCPPEKARINIRRLGSTTEGHIRDISSAGFAAQLDSTVEKNELCDDIQLNLWGSRLTVGARMYGTRKLETGQLLHIFMFEPELYGQTRYKVHQFIKRVIQAEVDEIVQTK